MLTIIGAVVLLGFFAGGILLMLEGAHQPCGSPEAGSLLAWGIGVCVVAGVGLGGALDKLL